MKGTLSIRPFTLALVFLLSFLSAAPAWPADEGYQTRPIPLGTSGGNIQDMSKIYCCSGTLGALVQDGNFQHILSNNHVLARTNRGTIGDDIIQPGLIDQNPTCGKDAGDAVADLSRFVPISFRSRNYNTVDAAIAQVRNGQVDPSGSILQIGPVSSSVLLPSLGLPVKKSGRTSGLTAGEITGIHATVKVTYNKSCGVGSQTATFTDQIVIGVPGFSAGGDSGSLVVDDCPLNPRAVGLLFAGSDTVTLANPIGSVLSALSVSLVGENGFCSSETVVASASTPAAAFLPAQANQRAVETARRVKERHEREILEIEGVVGIGVGHSDREPVIEVYVKNQPQEMRRKVPEKLEGVAVKIVVTGEIEAY